MCRVGRMPGRGYVRVAECPRDAVEAGSVHYTYGRGWHKSAYHRLQWRSNLP